MYTVTIGSATITATTAEEVINLLRKAGILTDDPKVSPFSPAPYSPMKQQPYIEDPMPIYNPNPYYGNPWYCSFASCHDSRWDSSSNASGAVGAGTRKGTKRK